MKRKMIKELLTDLGEKMIKELLTDLEEEKND